MGKENKVIHIADISPDFSGFLCPMVKAAQIKICQMLGNQVADGNPSARFCMVCIQNFFKKQKQIRVFELLCKQMYHNVMVNGIKIFADIKFQIPFIFPYKLLRSVQNFAVSLSFAAGMGIVYGVFIQKRFADVHNCMVQNPFRKRGRADGSDLNHANHRNQTNPCSDSRKTCLSCPILYNRVQTTAGTLMGKAIIPG